MPTVKKRTTKKKTTRKPKGVLDRIGPIDFGDNDGVRLNLYGRSGTGKTTLWSTFPAPILAIISSGSRKPGELRSINTPANRKRISQVALANTDEFKELVEHQAATDKFKTLVLDHGTGLQDLTLKEILGLDELPAQASWGTATQQDWGQCALQMKEMLRALLSLDCNVIIVAQEREFNTDSESSQLMPYVGSAMTPSVTGWLNPACDYICQTFIRQKMIAKKMKIGKKWVNRNEKTNEVEYCLRTGPNETYTTKFRLPKGTKLPEAIVDPTYQKIKALIDGGQSDVDSITKEE